MFQVDRLQLDEREKKKDEKRKMQDELNLLFKPVQGITKGFYCDILRIEGFCYEDTLMDCHVVVILFFALFRKYVYKLLTLKIMEWRM